MHSEICRLSFVFETKRTVAPETEFQIAPSETTVLRVREGTKIYRGFTTKGQVVKRPQKLLLIKETRYAKPRDLVLFCV